MYSVPVNVDDAAYLAFISLDEAKKWLRVQHSQEDDLITGLITGAIQYAERYCTLDFIQKDRVVYVYPVDYQKGRGLLACNVPVELPYGPDQTVTKLYSKYGSDPEEEITDLYPYYVTDKGYVSLYFGTASRTTYKVEYTSGTVDPLVLKDIMVALKQIITQWYVHREPIEVGTIVAKIPMAAQSILEKHKRNPVLA